MSEEHKDDIAVQVSVDYHLDHIAVLLPPWIEQHENLPHILMGAMKAHQAYLKNPKTNVPIEMDDE